jgi:DNA-binding CsgD family transcriptional regulator
MAERAWLTSQGMDRALAALSDARAMCSAPVAYDDIDLWAAILTESPLDWLRVAAERATLGMPFEEAVALLHADEASARKALALLEQLGANAALERARRLLGDRGIRGPRRTTLAHGAGLTSREADVLRLLGEGRSNKSIARALSISPKTVDHHVSSVINKMGATSRGQAVALALRQGLL